VDESVFVSFFLGVFVCFLCGFGALGSENEKEEAWMMVFLGFSWECFFFLFFFLLFSFLFFLLSLGCH
jgi:hypothetical protein